MKFGKEFASQMVPEWHETYVNYGHLKTLLKEIYRFKQKNNPTKTHPPSPAEAKRKLALYRAFSGLTTMSRFHEPPTSPTSTTTVDIENPVMDSMSLDGSTTYYETMFLKDVGDEGGEYELVYFRKLDEEFNKVHKFYMSKVEEVMEEAAMLDKQMHALVAFRIKVEKPHGWRVDSCDEMTRFDSDDETSTPVSASAPISWEKSSRRVFIDDVIEEGPSQEQSDESSDDSKRSGRNIQERKPNKLQDITPCPLEILERVTINVNVTLETPLSIIKVLLNVPKQTELKFSKENLKKAEEQLKQAFMVFYHKLRHLKSYSFMNVLAFSKIMKKYDKIASRSASDSYMKMVENSFLGSSNEVNNLIVRVEDTFIKHFSNSNRSKGMKMLRPKPKRERHRTTFSFGFFAGCTVTLILALVLIIRARDIIFKEGASQYMNTMFPLYSLFAFVVLHMIMYAGNIYFWRRYRVNYSFIFNLKHGRELGYRDVLYLSFGLAVLALASVLSNLDMEMDPKTHDYKAYTELVPLFVVVVIVAILICPFNILYRSSRFFFLKCVFRCICAPLYIVTLADCIMADQLTSQVQAFRSLEFYICYYGWGDYKHRENTCKKNDAYNTFSFIIAAIPFGIRLFQNVRLMYQTGNQLWGYNALKYFTTIVAVCTRTAYSLKEDLTWKIVAWICSAIAAIFCTYWDLVIDWGLLQRNSKNRWLRDKLFVPHKSVYFGAMVLNVLLRFAWLQTVLNFKISSLHTEALIAIVASLEIIRRGMWNFFRLEYEHLSNVSKFRAFKSVPLPFNYEDDDEGEDEDEVKDE